MRILIDGIEATLDDIAGSQMVAPIVEMISAIPQPPETPIACPNCGTKVQTACETGYVGCPLCYELIPQSRMTEFLGLSMASQD